MTVTTTVTRTTVLTTEDLPFDAVLEHEPDTYIDPVVVATDNGYTVSYAMIDTYPDDDMDYVLGDGATFEEFRTQRDRDAFIEAQDAEDHVYVVNHYEHGLSAYTVAGSARTVPDAGGFDTRPSGVLVLSGAAGYTDPDAAAEACMETYTSWVNGDVYILVREYFDAEGNTTEMSDICGGFIGSDYAVEALTSGDW